MKNAMQLLTKQTTTFHSAIPTTQTAPTVYLNATVTYQTPKMPTHSAILTSLDLRNNTPNAMRTTLFPKTIYLPAMVPFHLPKLIYSVAMKNSTPLKIILLISLST
jgi:hypothetical protein